MEYQDVNLETEGNGPDTAPSYLTDYSSLYKKNPYEAALSWRFAANLGLALNYGLHSVLGKGEHALKNGEMTPEDYRLLMPCLNSASFNTIDLVELCIASGARYLRFPAILPDGFCTFASPSGNFDSASSAARRDFVAELSSTCDFHGIGLALEINLGTPESSRPSYVQELHEQIHKLLTGYGPIAEIAFRSPYNAEPPEPDMEDICKLIRSLQNNTLISCGLSATGNADVLSAETETLPENLPEGKPLEINYFSTFDRERGFLSERTHTPLEPESMWTALKKAHDAKASLLVNLPLNPDGSMNNADMTALLELGMRLENDGLR